MGTITGKIVLVTGGASGIGYAIAQKFAQSNNRVVIVDANRPLGEEAAGRIPGAVYRYADVSKEEQIRAMVEDTIASEGRIDVLVNNAGISRHARSFELSSEDWNLSIDLMLSGVFHCSQAVGRHMARQGGGNIVNIASINSTISIPGRLAYSCSKAAVLAMTRILASEWAADRIRVNAVSPGVTMTGLMEDSIRSGLADERAYLSRIPLGRFAAPEEIADACCFVTSDQAGYMTGNNLVIDGGWTAYHWTDIGDGE